MKPSIPKGTRDFGPQESSRRNYIFSTIKDVFKLFGYSQIETPAMENLSTLLGKYGEEGDKLLFRILNSGDYLRELDPTSISSDNLSRVTSLISEKGLRYDLTVPFARFVVMNRNSLPMPFKRYQIQPVWRADRPQRGRYREFYQCDADVVGSDSLWNEVELIEIINEVFVRFGINVTVKVNNRKILAGIAEKIGVGDKLTDVTVAIDKIDKIGIEKVSDELRDRGIPENAIETLKPLLLLQGDNETKLTFLKNFLSESEIGLIGVEELECVVSRANQIELDCKLEVDISLARGLNYYTGIIIEVKANDVEIGSISGGGRYDNLTGVFGMSGLSGVGISFGADRIYDVLNQLDLYPSNIGESVKVLFVNFGEEEAAASAKLIKDLHKYGISAELYPDNAKMKKQLGYANDLHIPFVAMIGTDELSAGNVVLKNMEKGTQETISMNDFTEKITEL